ncbi:unannotated protein [freshwater metagenome]|uniref:Unannotated protein n=1 Tax=freshwater metagenome TaxID=449393 RepID=A0A6J6JEC5_9ZZZZ
MGAHTLVVVVDGHRQSALGGVLTDDIFVEEGGDFFRLGQIDVDNLVALALSRFGHALVDDLVTKFDTLITDIDTGTRNELLDLLLGLSTEGTLHDVGAVADT